MFWVKASELKAGDVVVVTSLRLAIRVASARPYRGLLSWFGRWRTAVVVTYESGLSETLWADDRRIVRA